MAMLVAMSPPRSHEKFSLKKMEQIHREKRRRETKNSDGISVPGSRQS